MHTLNYLFTVAICDASVFREMLLLADIIHCPTLGKGLLFSDRVSTWHVKASGATPGISS